MTHDVQPCAQAAINAAVAAGNAEVDFPAGTYYFGADLIPSDPFFLKATWPRNHSPRRARQCINTYVAFAHQRRQWDKR